MTHGQGQIQKIELAADERGKILGMRASLIGDAGPYLTGDSSDVTFTIKMLASSYDIPVADLLLLGALQSSCAPTRSKKRWCKVAAYNLGIDSTDTVVEPGSLHSKTDPGKSLSFAEAASLCYQPSKLPDGVEPVLFASSAFAPKNFTFPFGTHVVVVEIERETGTPRILEYTSADDCGKVINPMIVERQIHGGRSAGVRAGTS